MVVDTIRGKISDMTRDDGSTDPTDVYIRSAALGFVSGLRSLTPFALLSLLRRRNDENSPSPSNPLSYLDTPNGRAITTVIALGEFVGDKLPFAPSRITPGPLTGRVLIGALVGWAICRQADQSPILGALLGAVGAASGSAAGYYARIWLRKVTKLPDPLLGTVEDLLALGLGTLIARKVD